MLEVISTVNIKPSLTVVESWLTWCIVCALFFMIYMLVQGHFRWIVGGQRAIKWVTRGRSPEDHVADIWCTFICGRQDSFKSHSYYQQRSMHCFRHNHHPRSGQCL